jgi:hypothetical protein
VKDPFMFMVAGETLPVIRVSEAGAQAMFEGSKRLQLETRGRTCSFVRFAQAAPYNLDSPAERMQSRSIVVTPAQEYNQTLAT